MAHSYDHTPRDRERRDSRYELFRPIEFKESRKRSVWMSVAVHSVLLTVLLLIPLIFTEAIKIKYDTVLIAPPPLPLKPVLEATPYRLPTPKPEPKPKPLVAPPPVKPIVVQPPKPPEPPKLVEVKPPEVKPAPIVKNTPRIAEAAPTPAAPKLEVRTGDFSTASAPKPTTSLPPAKVQTGGFGDPNGIKGEGKQGKVANIASLGSFDLPAGAGAGNGTGGARGAKGTVSSSGFGNATATGNAGNNASNRVVHQGGFGDAEAAKSEGPKKRADTGPPQTPAEILSKPKPEYTEEARKLKIEGEALVRVLFTAAGEVRVLEVVRGLGHGLDETALRAARQIKFKPAQRDGQPVDSTATVHIIYQLAY